MKSRDVLGKRIVRLHQRRVGPDPEYYGPRIVCTQIELENGTRLIAHCYESSDQPIASIEVAIVTEQQRLEVLTERQDDRLYERQLDEPEEEDSSVDEHLEMDDFGDY